jgi:hypothetical protein
VPLSINNNELNCAECHNNFCYAEYFISIVMLSLILPNVIIVRVLFCNAKLNAVMLSVAFFIVMLGVKFLIVMLSVAFLLLC